MQFYLLQLNIGNKKWTVMSVFSGSLAWGSQNNQS